MYHETISEILVFKTDAWHPEDVDHVAKVLNDDARIKRWNIDRDDIDNVLRVEADQISAFEIRLLLNAAGYFCEELPD